MLASSQNISVGREEILESRGEVNDEKSKQRWREVKGGGK